MILRILLRPFLYLVCGLAASGFPVNANAATACVWRVTNVPVPFYLVGTVHALSGKDYPLPKPYSQALHESQRFLFEIGPDLKGDYGRDFVRAALYPEGDDIRRHIHPETWKFLAKNFRISNLLGKSFTWGGYHVEGLQRMRPWAIAAYVWGIRGYNDVFDEHGVDNYFSYHARRTHKETGSLESEQEHIEVLRGMPDINSEILLLDTLVRGDKRRDDFNAQRAGWKRGDLAPVLAEHKRHLEQNLVAELRLLDYRNLRWIPRIETEMKSGKPTSIVAGAAHFCGPNSVVDLLQRKGYKIEQL
jgi:uncharacterized protein